MLGVKLDPVYVERLKVTLENRNKPPKAPASAEDEDIENGYGTDWDDDFAYIAGWTSGGAPYGVTWDEMPDAEPVEDDLQGLTQIEGTGTG